MSLNTPRRRLVRFLLSLKIPYLRRRVGRLVMERIDEVSLVVLPDVFNPVVFRTTPLFARYIAGLPAVGAAHPAEVPAALELGVGSGALSLFAARRGYRVTGVDINAEAVRCARINAQMNHLDDRVQIHEGDLFAPVAGQRFDLVLFNPPFFRGSPKSALDMAWRSDDVPERFAAGLPHALTPDGRALILLSTDGDPEGMLAALQAAGLRVAPVLERDFGNEIMTIYEIAHSHRESPVSSREMVAGAAI